MRSDSRKRSTRDGSRSSHGEVKRGVSFGLPKYITSLWDEFVVVKDDDLDNDPHENSTDKAIIKQTLLASASPIRDCIAIYPVPKIDRDIVGCAFIRCGTPHC